jgi:hypothetical protein
MESGLRASAVVVAGILVCLLVSTDSAAVRSSVSTYYKHYMHAVVVYDVGYGIKYIVSEEPATSVFSVEILCNMFVRNIRNYILNCMLELPYLPQISMSGSTG